MNPPASKVCQVRVNLSYAIEMRADKEQSSEQASYLYNMAQGVLLEDNCASQQEDLTPRDKMAQSAMKRIDAKISQANNRSDADPEPDDRERKITDEEARQYGKELIDGFIYRDNAREFTQRSIRKNQEGSHAPLYVAHDSPQTGYRQIRNRVSHSRYKRVAHSSVSISRIRAILDRTKHRFFADCAALD